MRVPANAMSSLVIAVLGVWLLSFSACGSDHKGGGGAPSQSPTGTSRPSSTPTPPSLASPTPTVVMSACAATAEAVFRACGNQVQDDLWTTQAICINIADGGERAQCVADAEDARREADQLCADQLAGRSDACSVLGEGRYDPAIDPAAFDDDFAHLTNPNPYFPLGIGHRWEYHSATQVDIVEIVDETKLIEGVTCVVARDQVTDGGDLIETTDDWFAQAKDGNVWYFGEETRTFESFDGDNPRTPELVSIDGSFKAGRDGDKPGIIFQASPMQGQAYVEESSLGNAEDGTVVLSTTYAFGNDPDLDQLVPQQLAELLCSGDCVVTKNFSLLEPGIFERKYYARGIGVFLEVAPDSGEVVQLVNCNVDPRCGSLPAASASGVTVARKISRSVAAPVEPPQVEGPPCSATADALFRACGFSVQDDRWIAEGICINVSDDAERTQCFADAEAARDEGDQLCSEQLAGRRDACALLGEHRYDPDFDPDSFDDDFTHLSKPNRYFPLAIGNRWEYRGGTEVDTVEVQNKTKLIDDVTCIVVKDIVTDNGDLIEETDDWYAQAKNGAVWYCGEEAQDFESFDGDNPRRPELVSNDGSFKAGRDEDKPGIIFQASPRKGQSYLEEFSVGNAEDVTQVLSTTYAFGNDPELDQLVPQQLAELLCSGDCVVTKNLSPLEPGVIAHKYYARGIGVFLEVESTGAVSQLVSCNVDPRCSQLPTP